MRDMTVTESGANSWKARDRKTQNLLLESYATHRRRTWRYQAKWNASSWHSMKVVPRRAALFVLVSRMKRAFFHG
ncbi:hypothetical protein ABE28_013860 [Peribacillus muralis]|uniref:Uncharacterized protein n=1 Tax=Peribacillus muralis TaxID=264697 RepID=A0A1B3XQF4_9BACI|nr:hypothetical protein ABE28_013860 [Peribacillus muralis]